VETYNIKSDANGEAVIPVILQNRLYRFCADYGTGEVCYPKGQTGEIISTALNGKTVPILPDLNFPTLTTSSIPIQLTINNKSLINYSNDFYNYTIDFSWANIFGFDSIVCVRILQNYNYTSEIVYSPECVTGSSSSFLKSFLLNRSNSYIFQIYEKQNGVELKPLFEDYIASDNNFFEYLKSYGLFALVKIVLIIGMVAIIPYLKSPILIFGDIILCLFILQRFIITQSLSIIVVGVFIVIGVVTLWGIYKK
jgi:hypothetical protein